MSKIVSIAGVRPNFIKIDPDLPQEVWLTGQHFDKEMRDVFLKELAIHPTHDFICTKLGDMISAIQHQLSVDQPDLVIVYGDANSSVAGAIAAYQERIPIAHVEAGLRSGNPRMIEEKNRIIIDHIANLLFCPTLNAMYNLEKEGLYNGKLVGDPMYDQIKSHIKEPQKSENYSLLTLHRAENVDDKSRLIAIISGLEASKLEVWCPLHPRTEKRLKEFKLTLPKNVKVLKPVSYLAMLNLMAKAKKIITDSGGVQKEAYFLQKPTLTLRNETEWPETVADGWNVLLDVMENDFAEKLATFMPIGNRNSSFGDGRAWERIRKVLSENGYL